MSCVSPFSFLCSPWETCRGGCQPLSLLASVQLFHPAGVTPAILIQTQCPGLFLLPSQSQSTRQNPRMSEITLETLQKGVEIWMPSLAGSRPLSFLPGLEKSWFLQWSPHPRPCLYPKVLRDAQGSRLTYLMERQVESPTAFILFLPLSLPVYSAHCDECVMCCDFSVRSQLAFIEHLPCAKHDAKDLYHRVHSAEGSRQPISQLL